MTFHKLAAAASLLLSSAAFAENVVIGPSRLENDLIVTATGAGQWVETSGQAVTRIDQRDLDRLQRNGVAEILATTPGITVSRNGGIGGVTTVRIRGAEGDQTLALIDGVRLNDPSSPGGGFDFGNLLVGNIERIEVLRGPNSVPWGSQAIGGVVNIVTARPTTDFGTAARVDYGASDRLNAVANVEGRFGILAASIGGGYFRDDGISAFRDGVERDGYRQYAANGRLDLEISEDFTLDVRGYFADSRTRIDGFPPPAFSFADTAQFSTAQQVTAYAGANLRLFDGNLRNRLAFTLSDINRDNFDAPGDAVPTFLARGRTERFEYQGDARFGGGVRAVFGVEHERSRFGDGLAPVRTQVTSGYAQLILEPASNLTLTGGARLDDHRDYGREATFAANIAWRPVAGTIVRAAYGEGFKAPTLFQLFSALGNPLLEPEQATSYEIGIEQALIDGRLTLGATVFQRRTRNQIDFVSCFGQTTGICTGRPFGTFDTVDRTRARGLEASLRARPSGRLTLEANYSLIDTEDRATNLALLRRPRHTVNGAIDWEAMDWLRIGATLQIVSDSADTDFQTFTRTALDGYALAGLRATVPLSRNLEFYVRIENLFDTRYETVSGYGSYGRTGHLGLRARF